MRKYRTPAIVLLGLSVVMTAAATHASGDLKQAVRFERKGSRSLQTGDLAGAEKNYTKSLNAMPAFPAAHIGLGQIAMAQEDFEGALAHFEQARDGYTELKSLWNGLGVIRNRSVPFGTVG